MDSSNQKLVVEVEGAYNLQLPKHDGQRVFVVFNFDDQRLRTTASPVTQTLLNAQWRETLFFNVSDPCHLHKSILEAHLYTTHSKSSLGKVRLSCTPFVDCSDSWVIKYPLDRPRLLSAAATGELGLKVYVTNDPVVVAGQRLPSQPAPLNVHLNWEQASTNTEEEPPVAPINQPFKSGVRGMMSDIFDLPSYPDDFPSEGVMPLENEMVTFHDLKQMEVLFVRVVQARALDLTHDLNAHVVVKVGNYVGVTQQCEQIQNPEWNAVVTFSKDTIQSSVLEAIVKDKNDDFVGFLRLDINKIPTIFPEWHCLEDRKGEKKRGELLLAVWTGTQDDKAFSEAWHCDVARPAYGSFLSKYLHSRVYSTPRLWYVRINVIKAQDLVTTEKNHMPNVHVKTQIGKQVLKTKVVQAQRMNATWNEDFIFVAAEPFDDYLVFTVEDHIGPSKDKALGKVSIPLTRVIKRIDDRIVPLRWFNLQKPSASDIEETADKLAGQICLRICLDGGYHVQNESKYYSSDLRPSAKQLWKPPIGTLELGILNAEALSPMKKRNGRGTSDTYCVAKYGQEWFRTQTITDSLNPKYNEQYTWEVFDPYTVLTIGVFDNGQICERISNGQRDMKIGKVRIRISTLETGRLYTHSYPLLVLHPSGVEKMGELHLAVRFSCTSTVKLISLYSRTLLPEMHYKMPLTKIQLDLLHCHAVNMVAGRLSRTEHPLRKEVVEYMCDADSQLWSMRHSKASFFRLMSTLSTVTAVFRWFDRVCSWYNPITTMLVHALFIAFVCYPGLILPALFLYMFLCGIWNYHYRPRYPPHMDTRLSCADIATPDELDEEFDMFPTSPSAELVKLRYDRLRSIMGRVLVVLGDIASLGEKGQSLLSWRDPRATVIFIAFCAVAATVLSAVPFRLFVVMAGLYRMRHPKFRSILPSASVSFYRRLPARIDSNI